MKLLSFELEMEHLDIEGTQRYMRQENSFSSVLTQYNFYDNAISLEAMNHQPSAIAKSIRRVIFRSNIIGHPILSFKTCGGSPLGVSVFRKSGG
jgi:hypothetical protein